MGIVFDLWIGVTTLGLLLAAYRSFSFSRSLPSLQGVEIPSDFEWPKVSMVIPACNEARTLEAAALSLLAMDYPRLELIFVNDRSTDETGGIIDGLAKRDARVRPLHIRELPAGWLGKVHALAKGSELATGEWILVSDADVHFGRRALKKAVVFSNARGLDFLTALPTLRTKSLLLRLFVTHFGHLLTIFSTANGAGNKGKGGLFGVGAFLFMRREVFAKSEGFEWIRMEVLDDAGVALIMKRAGAVMGGVSGKHELELEWYPDALAFIRGLEKNVFAMAQYSVIAVAAMLAASATMAGGLFIAPFYSTSLGFGVAAWSALAICLLVFALEARRVMQVRVWEVFLTPLAFMVFPLIMVRSAAVTLWNGGVRWRTSFYPLAELRAHQRLTLLTVVRQGRSGSDTDKSGG